MSDHGRVGRTFAVVTASASTLVLLAAPAAAHVSVEPLPGQEARVGESVTVAIRVPNERALGTERVELVFPEPMGQVTIAPTPGWTVSAETAASIPIEPLSRGPAVPILPVHEGDDHTDGGQEPSPPEPPAAGAVTFTDVTELVWQGGPLAAEEVVDFVATLGPLPDTPTLVLAATQTYEDGEVVRWVQEPADTELAFPAPTLEVAGATVVSGTTTTEAPGDDESTGAARAEGDGGSDWWRTALVVVAAALVVGGVTARVVAQRRIRRESARP